MKTVFINIKIILYSFYSALVSRGPIPTLEMSIITLLDMYEDYRRGLVSNVFIDPRSKLQPSIARNCANFHQPVRSIPFRKLFAKISIPENSQFIDIGAGTGKAMILAMDLGFKNVHGIEIVSDLVDYGKKNYEKVKNRYPEVSWRLEVGDASKIKFEGRNSIIFLNDPFDDPIFANFLTAIDYWKKSNPSISIVFIYKNNNKRKIPSFEEWVTNKTVSEFDIYGNYFIVVKI